LFLGMENLVFAKRVEKDEKKFYYLIKVETHLNIMKIFVRIAKKNKYINSRNYTAWSYKIAEIDNMLSKWRKACQKQ